MSGTPCPRIKGFEQVACSFTRKQYFAKVRVIQMLKFLSTKNISNNTAVLIKLWRPWVETRTLKRDFSLPYSTTIGRW